MGDGLEEMNRADLMQDSVRALRQRCEARGISTTGMIEKADIVNALLADADMADTAEVAAAFQNEEEMLLQQAMLASCETEDSISELSVRELRSRCAARGIDTAGILERAELVAALRGRTQGTEETALVARLRSAAATSLAECSADRAEVIAAFQTRFRCFRS